MSSPSRPHITERYSASAEAYLTHWAPILLRAGQALAAEFRASAPERVVDVGCGVGALLPTLGKSFPAAQVVGIDLTLDMLRRADPRFDRAVSNAAALPLRDASADLLLYCFMLFHLDDPVDALLEARRVLRPGGRVGTLTWGCSERSAPELTWIECLDDFGADPLDPSLYAKHEVVDTTEKMRRHFEAAGFDHIDSRLGELVERTDPETFLAQKQGLGSQKPRYDSLDDETRRACSQEALRRLRELPGDAFVQRHSIVITRARVER